MYFSFWYNLGFNFFQVYHLNNLMKLLLQEQEQLEQLQHQEDEAGGTGGQTTSNWSDKDISTDTISRQARQGSLSNKCKSELKNSEVLTRLGPCMEFVIERQILDILSTLCQADIPPGLRPHIIRHTIHKTSYEYSKWFLRFWRFFHLSILVALKQRYML